VCTSGALNWCTEKAEQHQAISAKLGLSKMIKTVVDFNSYHTSSTTLQKYLQCWCFCD